MILQNGTVLLLPTSLHLKPNVCGHIYVHLIDPMIGILTLILLESKNDWPLPPV